MTPVLEGEVLTREVPYAMLILTYAIYQVPKYQGQRVESVASNIEYMLHRLFIHGFSLVSF